MLYGTLSVSLVIDILTVVGTVAMAELLQRVLSGPEGLDVALLEQIVNVLTVPGASQEQVCVFWYIKDGSSHGNKS